MKQIKDIKFLAVEDGSIDVDELEEYIKQNDLPIRVIVYRQGSQIPVFVDERGIMQNE